MLAFVDWKTRFCLVSRSVGENDGGSDSAEDGLSVMLLIFFYVLFLLF